MHAEIGIIRQFRAVDAGECSKLVRASLSADPMIPAAAKERLILGETPEVMRERAALFYMPVYVLENRIAGVGGVDLNEIRLLFVDLAHQRRGIGSALLRHLEAFVPPALFANIFVYSALGAQGFYRAHGYQPGGEHEYRFEGFSIPTVFMTKRIAG